jgi:PAS domain S-box-containing protein
VGATDADVFPPDWVKRSYRQGDEALAADHAIQREDSFIGVDGRDRWMLRTKRGVRLADGSTHVNGIVTDTTEMKNGASEADLGRAFVDAVVNLLPDPISVKDEEGRVVLLILAARQNFGADAGKIIGRAGNEILGRELSAEYDEEDRRVFAAQGPLVLNEVRLGPDGQTGLVVHVETRGCTGGRLPIPRRHDDRRVAPPGDQRLLEAQREPVSTVNAIASAMAQSLPLDEMLRVAVNSLSLATDGVQARFLRLYHGHMVGTVHAAADGLESELESDIVDLRLCPAYFEAIRTEEILVIDDLACDDCFSTMRAGFLVVLPGAVIDVPIRCGDTLTGIRPGQVLGAISLPEPEPRIWLDNEVAMIGEISDALAVAVLSANVEQERRIAETALRGSEARFRGPTELSSEWFREQDASFRFTLVSKGVEGHEAAAPEEMIGRTRWEAGNPIPPDDDPDWSANRALVEAHEPFRDLVFRVERPDGALRVLCISGQPHFDTFEEFGGYRGVGRDITEDVRVQEELREHRDNLQQLVEERTRELIEAKEVA